jgi:uncharacterized membrane protein (DUF485 family)
MGNPAAADTAEPLGMSLLLTSVQVIFFLSFLLTACFASKTMQVVVPGLGWPLSFVFGLAVIACGTLLTVMYVIRANASEG